jgi:hypothetical protein
MLWVGEELGKLVGICATRELRRECVVGLVKVMFEMPLALLQNSG